MSLNSTDGWPDLRRNTRPICAGLGGRFETESVADLVRNTQVDFIKLLKHHNFDIRKDMGDYSLEFEFGKKLIRIWKCHPKKDERIDVVGWFTTEKILYDKWCCHPGIIGFDNYRDFTRYYLHYIGISKEDDSLTRLVVKPHDKRLRILSNENPLTFGSRLTDEIILFFFKIEPLRASIMKQKKILMS